MAGGSVTVTLRRISEKKIHSTTARPALVSMGPDGEWFVKFSDASGTVSCLGGTVSDKLDAHWDRAEAVQSLVFGMHGSFFLRGTF
mmetsp:Transcript_42393/g.103885  ORF Transcript_42393/g.103885 Transcript_42393/m.103885 type:complete len:86 (+) Transcript_42393:871-1128(+)